MLLLKYTCIAIWIRWGIKTTGIYIIPSMRTWGEERFFSNLVELVSYYKIVWYLNTEKSVNEKNVKTFS